MRGGPGAVRPADDGPLPADDPPLPPRLPRLRRQSGSGEHRCVCNLHYSLSHDGLL